MAQSLIATPSLRNRTSRCAHVIERIGLAMAGASCGLFVATHVSNARVEALSSVGFILATMVLGAVGFYLGIDVPPHRAARNPSSTDSTDPVELLSAAGTFLAATAAFMSVYTIVVDADASNTATTFLSLCWLLGATMQIVAGLTARMRKT